MRSLHRIGCRAEPGVKKAGLNLVASALEGLGERDRNVITAQIDGLKAAAAVAKDRSAEPDAKWVLSLCTQPH